MASATEDGIKHSKVTAGLNANAKEATKLRRANEESNHFIRQRRLQRLGENISRITGGRARYRGPCLRRLGNIADYHVRNLG